MKIGDRVEMLSNLSKEELKMKKPRIGFVEAVNGDYILVRPRYKKYQIDFLRNEVKLYIP